MRIGLAFLIALSLAMLPMARAFVASGDEVAASGVIAASAHDGCAHEAMASDVVISSAHECCHHDAVPSDHAMKVCSPDCVAKCSGLYAVLFSEQALPSAISGTGSHFVSKSFHSRTTSPPFRPPRA